jgi:ribosome biogenesis GTPase A
MAQQASRKPVFPPEIAPYIDVGAYLLDSRAPAATLYLDETLAGKEILLLTRAGQADPKTTKRWQHFFQQSSYSTFVIDSITGEGLPAVLDYLAVLLQRKLAYAARRGVQAATLRVVALGVPNVGKSTFLNALLGEKHLKVGDRPGITRGRQWVRLFDDVEVLDTPGVLRDPAGLNRRKPYWQLLNLMPYDYKLREDALELLLTHLNVKALTKLWKFYRHKGEPRRPDDWLQLAEIASRRSLADQTDDNIVDQAARRVLRDFQLTRFGRISLEEPETAIITSPVFRGPEGQSYGAAAEPVSPDAV